MKREEWAVCGMWEGQHILSTDTSQQVGKQQLNWFGLYSAASSDCVNFIKCYMLKTSLPCRRTIQQPIKVGWATFTSKTTYSLPWKPRRVVHCGCSFFRQVFFFHFLFTTTDNYSLDRAITTLPPRRLFCERFPRQPQAARPLAFAP